MNDLYCISKKQLIGSFAGGAVTQSPYLLPDNLPEAIKDVFDALKFDDYSMMTRKQLQDLLENIFENTPSVEIWNHRKNGNESRYGFCSRYDKPDPDDDFIDLGALARNITYACCESSGD